MKKVSTKEMISELAREVSMRERLYPEWIRKGWITEHQAAQQLYRMKLARDILDKASQNLEYRKELVGSALQEVEREMEIRRTKYPEWIQIGKLHRAVAERQWSRLDKAKVHLQELHAGAKLTMVKAAPQGKLF